MNYIFYRISRLFLLVLFKILFRFKVYGKENVPRRGAFLLAGNHASVLDPIILGISCSRIVHYIAKEELFRNKFFGAILTRVCAFPVRREALTKETVKKALGLLSRGEGVVIFPEGGRTTDGAPRQVQAGVGMIAKLSNAVVVPAYIDGSAKILPKGSKMIRPRKVRIYFGRPLSINEFDIQDKKDVYQKFSNKVMEEVYKMKP